MDFQRVECIDNQEMVEFDGDVASDATSLNVSSNSILINYLYD